MRTLALTLFIALFCNNINSQWSECTTGIPFTIFSVSAVTNDVVWAAASGSNVLLTTNGGNSWTNAGATLPPPAGVITNVWAFDANTAIVCNYAGSPVRSAYAYKTSNAGQNWIKVFEQGSNAFLSGFWFKNATTGIMIGWPVGGRWSIWRSTNAGSNWDSSGLYLGEPDPSTWSFENGLFYKDSKIWFGARGKGVFYSTNDGTNWTLQSLPGGGYLMPSAVWFDTPTNGFSSGAFNIVYTTNSGLNWTLSQNTDGQYAIRGIAGMGNEWWYIREVTNTIHYTSNYGANWSVQYTAPTSTYRHLTKARNGNTLWASRVDGGISKYTPAVGGIKNITGTPNEFKLEQNFPNPFNPVTVIRFNIGASAPRSNRIVILEVYNSLGKVVKTLVDNELNAGTYEIEFDGSELPSGVYYYKLQITTKSQIIFSETKKMLLIK